MPGEKMREVRGRTMRQRDSTRGGEETIRETRGERGN